MTLAPTYRSILVIGAGPSVIGQGGAFDAAGASALRTLRGLGLRTILVTSSAASRTADPAAADVTYIEPLTPAMVASVIAAERPDALLPIVGGQPALNLILTLEDAGIFGETDIAVLGTTPASARICQKRSLLCAAASRCGMTPPEGREARNPDEVLSVAGALGYPVVIRPDGVIGGVGGGVAYNMEEAEAMATRALAASVTGRVMVQKALRGWRHLEITILRDGADETRAVGFVETADPLEINGADALAVTPFQTVSDDIRARVTGAASALAEQLDIRGPLSIQFAMDPGTGELRFVDAAPRICRSAGLIQALTGVHPAGPATLAALGRRFDDMGDEASPLLAPAADRVAVRLPRWPFDRIVPADDRLDTVARAVGESMGVARTLADAFAMAVRGVAGETAMGALGAIDCGTPSLEPASGRIFRALAAIRSGAAVADIAARAGIPADLLRPLAGVGECPGMGGVSRIPGTIFLYPDTPDHADLSVSGGAPAVIFAGSGPDGIGLGEALDASLIAAARAAREAGYAPVLVTPVPWAAESCPPVFERAWIRPVTVADLTDVVEKESAIGVVAGVTGQFGGPHAMTVVDALEGVRVLGPPAGAAARMADLVEFRRVMKEAGLLQPRHGLAASPEAVAGLAGEIGYPVCLRFTDRTGRRRVAVAQDADVLATALSGATGPVFVEQFLENALEAEADALADIPTGGGRFLAPLVIEHIERAGVHSGDSAQVAPPLSLSPRHEDAIRDGARRMAAAFGLIGVFNVRFAIANDTVYLMRARLGASRTLPMTSRVTGMDLAGMAARLLLGLPAPEMDRPVSRPAFYGVKEAAIPFTTFTEMDPVLGPEMRATGQVLGLSPSFGRAFFKSQEAVGMPPPLQGAVLITIADRDKPAILEVVRQFRDMGFRLLATSGTGAFLGENGIVCETVRKLGYGRPDILDAIKTGRAHLVINTPSDRRSEEDDSYIRKACIQYGVPHVTSVAAALAAARGINARRQGPPVVAPLPRPDAAR